jgi:hypothetical protein
MRPDTAVSPEVALRFSVLADLIYAEHALVLTTALILALVRTVCEYVVPSRAPRILSLTATK